MRAKDVTREGGGRDEAGSQLAKRDGEGVALAEICGNAVGNMVPGGNTAALACDGKGS